MRLLTPLFLAFLLLAAAAVLSAATARARRFTGWLHFALAAEAAAFLVWTGLRAAVGGGMEEAVLVRIGPFAVPFLIDGLAGLFLVVIGIVSAAAALYSVRYMDHYAGYSLRGYYFRLPLFILGLAALVTIDDLSIGFSLAWQIMTIASFLLIRFEYKERTNIRVANRYLLLMELAWALIVAAGFLLGGRAGDSLHELGIKAGTASPTVLAGALALLLLGFGLKAGVFPLGQLWLPDAHSVAPSPVSALLSGVMLKTGIFGLIRTFFFLAPGAGSGFDPRPWGAILATIGAATLFIGTLQSVKQSDAKRLLAYSSIGQIGYIVLGLGAALYLSAAEEPALIGLAAVAVLGALCHVLNHAIFKGLLFLTGGSLFYATGTKDLNRLGGLVRWMPVSTVLAAVASLAIAGMPPGSGFASKWTIIASTLLAGQGWVMLVPFGIVALFTSAVTLACYVKFFGLAFTASGAEAYAPKPIHEVPGSMLAAKIGLAAICLAQGLLPFLFVRFIAGALVNSPGFALGWLFQSGGWNRVLDASVSGLRIGKLLGPAVSAAFSPPLVLGLLLAALALGAWLRRSAGSRERAVPTWLCGYRSLDERTRFTDRGMFASLKDLFRWTGGRMGPKE
ncbi:MAG: proton-conducting transporter membrane subunit [Candidatus Aminicenantes bacterium]|nr:proton-conducting transporter membrane subunit [Candidatus Aminicenantes bacterium]